MPTPSPRVPDPGPRLSDWLRGAADALTQAGLDSPRVDAERLASHGLGVPWSQLWPRMRDPLSGPEASVLHDLLVRRARLEPLAYITGSTVFCGLEIACTPDALVPRPETETLVDAALDLMSPDGVVADVGTGTGAVALAIASARGDAAVWATDASPAALDLARSNADRLGLHIRFARGDLLDPLPQGLDLVVSNPPYVPSGRTDLLGPDVVREPPEALFAGPEGDEVLRRLVAEAPSRLAADGALALEVGTPQQAEAVSSSLARWERHGVRHDATGRPRVVWARGPR